MWEQEQNCSLLGGSWAIIAQILLGMIAFSSLIVKRAREDPKRSLNIWLMDVSKQAISLFMAHTLAILAAMLTTSLTHHGTSQCAWYFVMYFLDTVLGTMIAYMLHTTIISAAQTAVDDRKLQEGSNMMSLAQYVIACGDYGDPVSLRRWFWQVVEWTFCVLFARLCCGGMMMLFSNFLVHVASVIDALFGQHTTLELYCVMVFGPLLMNAVQALVQDAILKAKVIHLSPRIIYF